MACCVCVYTGWAKSRYTVIILYITRYCTPTFGPLYIYIYIYIYIYTHIHTYIYTISHENYEGHRHAQRTMLKL